MYIHKNDAFFIQWDHNKSQLNIEKHGVDFSEAASVLFDSNVLELVDQKHSQHEERYLIIGKALTDEFYSSSILQGVRKMAKKSIIELSVQELRTKKNAASISRKIKDSEIDYSDIPEFTSAELKKFKRRGRPVIGDSPRKAISIRVDEMVLKKLKSKALKKGIAYQTLINDILKKAV